MYKRFFKRFCDVIASGAGLLVASPVLLVSIVVLAAVNGGHPFFFQLRPGKHGRIFRIIKFRTMNNKKGSDGKLLSDCDRLTKIGKFVRSTSIDELPQMINVLKGDMSFIGPRPLLVEYLPLYSKEQALRHEVRPGITGWAQINGRNAISWERKLQYDVQYVENLSFLLDVEIIMMTIKKIIQRADINSATAATMEKFNGNN